MQMSDEATFTLNQPMIGSEDGIRTIQIISSGCSRLVTIIEAALVPVIMTMIIVNVIELIIDLSTFV